MSATGYIQVHAYASNAQLPLKDVAITISAEDGSMIAMRLTDRSGRIEPIAIPAPDLATSQTPGSAERPFVTVNLSAQTQGYELIRVEGLQIFPDTTTDQDLEMIPLSELPQLWSQSESFYTPPQNL